MQTHLVAGALLSKGWVPWSSERWWGGFSIPTSKASPPCLPSPSKNCLKQWLHLRQHPLPVVKRLFALGSSRQMGHFVVVTYSNLMNGKSILGVKYTLRDFISNVGYGVILHEGDRQGWIQNISGVEICGCKPLWLFTFQPKARYIFN